MTASADTGTGTAPGTGPAGSPSADTTGLALPGWSELEELAETHGDGFWLLDLEMVRDNTHRFRRAFRQAGWPRTEVAWSYKTSWLPPVVAQATRAGALSEVVSRHEYELALAMGVDPASIIVNGPLKDRLFLDRACGLGSQVHLDGPDEVADLVALARSSSGSYRLGLRANIDIGQPDRGRFGFDAETGELQRAARTLRAEPGIVLDGLHVHVSGAREAGAFTRRIERLIDLADELWPDGDGPRFLDVGGGFGGTVPPQLAAQLSSQPASPDDYAAAIVPALRRRWPSGGPRLITEPGMALAADVMRFAARVGAVKDVGGRRHAIVAATVHTVKPTLHALDMPFSVVRARVADAMELSTEPTVVSGWSCMEKDILSGSSRQALHRGDWIVFDNCGAYTFVLNPRFIRGTPAIVARDGAGGAWRTVRDADTVEDWLRPFRARG